MPPRLDRVDDSIRVLPEQISFRRSFWYVVHEDYAKLERIKVVSEAMIQQMRKTIKQAEAQAEVALT